MNTNILSINRSEIVRMVGIAHMHYGWEVAEFVTGVAMLFGPAPLGDEAKENDVICLDRLTMNNNYMWNEVKNVQIEAAS